jgi:hypothetical protein
MTHPLFYFQNFACGEVRGKLREVRRKLRNKCPKFELEDCCLNSSATIESDNSFNFFNSFNPLTPLPPEPAKPEYNMRNFKFSALIFV